MLQVWLVEANLAGITKKPLLYWRLIKINAVPDRRIVLRLLFFHWVESESQRSMKEAATQARLTSFSTFLHLSWALTPAPIWEVDNTKISSNCLQSVVLVFQLFSFTFLFFVTIHSVLASGGGARGLESRKTRESWTGAVNFQLKFG